MSMISLITNEIHSRYGAIHRVHVFYQYDLCRYVLVGKTKQYQYRHIDSYKMYTVPEKNVIFGAVGTCITLEWYKKFTFAESC